MDMSIVSAIGWQPRHTARAVAAFAVVTGALAGCADQKAAAAQSKDVPRSPRPTFRRFWRVSATRRSRWRTWPLGLATISTRSKRATG